MLERVAGLTVWGKDQATYSVSMPIAGNYYPLASPGAIRIRNSGGEQALAVVTDRAHGATSLRSGQVEVML